MPKQWIAALALGLLLPGCSDKGDTDVPAYGSRSGSSSADHQDSSGTAPPTPAAGKARRQVVLHTGRAAWVKWITRDSSAYFLGGLVLIHRFCGQLCE
jgi:hypothetical protein